MPVLAAVTRGTHDAVGGAELDSGQAAAPPALRRAQDRLLAALDGATLRSVLRRWLNVLLVALTALVAASPASASSSLGPQTRVGAFELAAHTLVGPAAVRIPEHHRAKSAAKPAGASDPRLRWKGRPFLEVAGGVYDMRARWWSPRLGSFLSADQFGYFDANSTLWGWGDQNPAKWNDPTGNCGPQCVGIAGGAAAGLAIGLYQTNWNGSAADIASDLAFATAAGAVVGGTLGEGYGAVAAAYELGGGTLAGAARVLLGGAIAAAGSPAAQNAESQEQGAACSLSGRAQTVQSVLQDDIAQRSRTTAALDTSGGRIIAGGGRDLSPAQRDALLPDEIAAKAPGLHAEMTALQKADELNYTPQAIAASRPFCTECSSAIENSGGVITSPTTAVWPNNQ